MRGRVNHEDANPLKCLSQRLYEPLFWWVKRHLVITLAIVLLLVASPL